MSTPLPQHSDCCLTGYKHEGTPVGKLIDFGGMNTYVSEPPATKTGAAKKILFYLTDIYGPKFINNQLNCDYFAANGYIVLSPDYFFGKFVYDEAKEPGFDFKVWKAQADKKAAEALSPWIEAAKEKYGTSDAKYAVVGYCFGAPYTVKAAATDLISAAAFAHPGPMEMDDIKAVKAPLLMSLAEIDEYFPVEKRRLVEDILVAQKATYHIAVFSGVQHGFAVRADLTDPNARWCREESARGVLSWFDRFCN